MEFDPFPGMSVKILKSPKMSLWYSFSTRIGGELYSLGCSNSCVPSMIWMASQSLTFPAPFHGCPQTFSVGEANQSTTISNHLKYQEKIANYAFSLPEVALSVPFFHLVASERDSKHFPTFLIITDFKDGCDKNLC